MVIDRTKHHGQIGNGEGERVAVGKGGVTHALEADVALVADGAVRFLDGWRTLG